MNCLHGEIVALTQSGAIVLADVKVDGHRFSAMMIDGGHPTPLMTVGNSVELIFKETEVSLAKDLSGKISLRNRIPCVVKHYDRGEVLTRVELTFQTHTIVSAITTRSFDWLEIATGDAVEALIKANEISLKMIQ
jgi:molybdate transport system regulatory protein